MLSNYIYDMPMVISTVFAIFSLYNAIRCKDLKRNKLIIIFNIINLIYLYMIAVQIPEWIPININLSILFTWIFSEVGTFLFILSTIICLIKRKKATNDSKNYKRFKIATIILLVLPVIIFIPIFGRELYLVNNSNIILIFHSSGNGGIGDSKDFTYVINDNYCEITSLKLTSNNFLLPKAKEVTEEELLKYGYKFIWEGEKPHRKYNTIKLYKDDKLIHEKEIDKSFFNNRLEHIYYNNNH